MSSVTYRYEQSYSFKKKGIKHTIKEQLIDGEKGLSIMYLKKTGEDFFKLYIKEVEKDKFAVETKEGEKVTESEINEKDLLKLLKTHKLDAFIEFINKERGTYKGKKVSKKVIKLGKKVSKKVSKLDKQ